MRQLTLLCLVAVALCANEVTIDLYMESECPGCMAFVKGELKRALNTKDFNKIAKLQVFPYGNARQTQNADGTWSFTCQHGPTECYGNLLEVCGMSRIQEYFSSLCTVPTRRSDTCSA
jgi:interferon, gamma-inducible protein 30